jgi:hypothetical protein
MENGGAGAPGGDAERRDRIDRARPASRRPAGIQQGKARAAYVDVVASPACTPTPRSSHLLSKRVMHFFQNSGLDLSALPGA